MASSSVDLTGPAASNLAQQTAQAEAMKDISATNQQAQGETAMAVGTDRFNSKTAVEGFQGTQKLAGDWYSKAFSS